MIFKDLTDCEREVVQMVINGYTDTDIASATSRKRKTVSATRHRALDKLGLCSNSELGSLAVRYEVAAILNDYDLGVLTSKTIADALKKVVGDIDFKKARKSR